MATDRLESLMRFHPFTRLNKLLESVQAGGGNTPLALSVGEPQFTPPQMVQRLIAEQFPLWGKYPQALGNEPFRKAAAGWLTRRFRLPEGMVDPAKHVMPVSGTREALFHIALSAVPEVSALLGHKDSYVTWKIYAHFVRKESTAVQDLATSILAAT